MTEVIRRSKAWVEQIVIGLNLCPFAKAPANKGLIHYAHSQASDEEELLEELWQECQQLIARTPAERETTLLIHPDVGNTFTTYLDLLEDAQKCLEDWDLEGILQIASFHPDYQFHGTEADALENYTNRSPYPMLHLLREESVSWAVEQHPDTEQIPEANQERLRDLGQQRFFDLLKKLR